MAVEVVSIREFRQAIIVIATARGCQGLSLAEALVGATGVGGIN